MAAILVIDDENSICQLFKYVFEDAGYTVGLAANGLEALEALRRGYPDFMILDVAMPVMSGKEFMVELNKRALSDPRLDSIPFVVMTGENFMEPELNKVFSSAKGFVCYFPKMTPPEEVLAKAREILDKAV